jgi:uncharacterized protein (DUF58 family)
MIRALWRRHRWLFVAFLAAVALALLFAVRVAIYMQDWPEHADEDIEGWMTPRYVALSWDVPPDVIVGALSIPRDGSGRRITLDELAKERGIPVETLAADLEAAIAAFRAGP